MPDAGPPEVVDRGGAVTVATTEKTVGPRSSVRSVARAGRRLAVETLFAYHCGEDSLDISKILSNERRADEITRGLG